MACLLACWTVSAWSAERYENCGKGWSIAEPPHRILALNQHSADLLLALGAGSSLIGVAYIDDDGALEQGRYRGVPVISRQYPSSEMLYSQRADLVVGGFGSAFREHLSSRQTLASHGIASYLLESGCDGHSLDYFGQIRQDLKTLGQLLRQPARADALIAAMDADLAAAAALHQGEQPLSVFYLDSEVNGLDSVGKRGFVTALLSAAGARNSFADHDSARLVIDSETLLKHDPEVILLADAVWSPARRKRQLLRSDPALSQLRAVRENRLIDIPFTQLLPTLDSGRVALELARRLKTLRTSL
nr:ABC transporter substrate-binding protein [Pseudomonas chlororaphis]